MTTNPAYVTREERFKEWAKAFLYLTAGLLIIVLASRVTLMSKADWTCTWSDYGCYLLWEERQNQVCGPLREEEDDDCDHRAVRDREDDVGTPTRKGESYETRASYYRYDPDAPPR